ncbi:unnamed protein product [Prorocentrum cordatum]|uniref:DNA 3'-5' helicase n=1 Tax=Prorocentrum cordatum TaxID=2364126 RepID=A0ABN9PQ94_9DINO|nr:unnamed protein product [Polarella glacialis]
MAELTVPGEELEQGVARFVALVAAGRGRPRQVALPPASRHWAQADPAAFPWVPELQRLLRQHWGHDDLRGLQLPVINALLSGKDVFTVMPTGAGKSLCYQLPILLQTGVAVVVSPLLSLMQDQVQALQTRAVKAARLGSDTSKAEEAQVLADLEAGNLSLLYVSPERMVYSSENCHRLTRALRQKHGERCLRYFVLDEAHCISQWGLDFRKQYRQLSCLRRDYPGVPILAATASATERVKKDVIRSLDMQQAVQFQDTFDRPNLFLEVRQKASDAKVPYCIPEPHHTSDATEFDTPNLAQVVAASFDMETALGAAILPTFHIAICRRAAPLEVWIGAPARLDSPPIVLSGDGELWSSQFLHPSRRMPDRKKEKKAKQDGKDAFAPPRRSQKKGDSDSFADSAVEGQASAGSNIDDSILRQLDLAATPPVDEVGGCPAPDAALENGRPQPRPAPTAPRHAADGAGNGGRGVAGPWMRPAISHSARETQAEKFGKFGRGHRSKLPSRVQSQPWLEERGYQLGRDRRVEGPQSPRNFALRFGTGTGETRLAAEIYVGLDKTKQDIAWERACKQLKTSLSSFLQKDIFQWQPTAKVEVLPCDPPTARWNAASLADLGLERAQSASAADRILI